MRLGVFAVAIVAGLMMSASSLAGSRTTSPTLRLTVLVQISDKGIDLRYFRWDASGNLFPVIGLGAAQRGGLATFNVSNVGKKKHDFTILGRKTPVVGPGQRKHFNVFLKARGTFVYRSTVDTGKSFRGVFVVA